ncbi:MAG: hypothetical protein NC131_01230 [Roseburia sp.]|nr:hypothetical protein [Roseburia sp.]
MENKITINGVEITTEQRTATNTFYHFTSKHGERITVELTKCVTPEKLGKNDLMCLWVKNGYLPAVLPSWFSVEVYAYDEKGNCWGWYNPQIIDYRKFDKHGKQIESRHIINFDWVFEATEQNRNKILAEIVNRANNKTPTVQKYEYETATA